MMVKLVILKKKGSEEQKIIHNENSLKISNIK